MDYYCDIIQVEILFEMVFTEVYMSDRSLEGDH